MEPTSSTITKSSRLVRGTIDYWFRCGQDIGSSPPEIPEPSEVGIGSSAEAQGLEAQPLQGQDEPGQGSGGPPDGPSIRGFLLTAGAVETGTRKQKRTDRGAYEQPWHLERDEQMETIYGREDGKHLGECTAMEPGQVNVSGDRVVQPRVGVG